MEVAKMFSIYIVHEIPPNARGGIENDEKTHEW